MSAFIPFIRDSTQQQNTTHRPRPHSFPPFSDTKDPKELVSNTKYLAWHYVRRSSLFRDGQLLDGITKVEIKNGCVSHKGYKMILPKSVRFLGGRLVGKCRSIFVDEREGWKEGFEPEDAGASREEGNSKDLEPKDGEARDEQIEESGSKEEKGVVGETREGKIRDLKAGEEEQKRAQVEEGKVEVNGDGDQG